MNTELVRVKCPVCLLGHKKGAVRFAESEVNTYEYDWSTDAERYHKHVCMDCGYKFAEVSESLKAESPVWDSMCDHCGTVKEDINYDTTAMHCNACGRWFMNNPVRRSKT